MSNGVGDAVFPNRRAAIEQRDFMAMGMDDYQSISVVPADAIAGDTEVANGAAG